MKNFILNNGMEIPWIGLGTYPMQNEECEIAVKMAAKNGYTLFDSSASYRNAVELGGALRKSFSKRSDYIVMTKLANSQQRMGNVKRALIDSLRFLGMDYVDLYLLHWPHPGTYIECYQQMEELMKEGLIRAIGVSNFHEHHLKELLQYASVVPAVNQIELHPLLNQNNLVAYCKKKGIQIVSYSPFARMHESLISNSTLGHIADKYDVRVTQVIIRWNYQHGYVVIPKSANKARQLENISVSNFILSEEEMNQIDDCNQNFRVRYNPDTCDYTKL